MRAKSSRPRRSVQDNGEINRLVGDIYAKLDDVLFNGGLDSIQKSVQNIETGQRDMLEKIEELKTAMYAPDDGLYARLMRIETNHDKEVEPMRRDMDSLLEWKKQVTGENGIMTHAEMDHVQIAQLMTWKTKIAGLVLSGVGALLLMLLKLAHEFVTSHLSWR